MTEEQEDGRTGVNLWDRPPKSMGQKTYYWKTAYEYFVKNYQEISEQELFNKSRKKWTVNLTAHNGFWEVSS